MLYSQRIVTIFIQHIVYRPCFFLMQVAWSVVPSDHQLTIFIHKEFHRQYWSIDGMQISFVSAKVSLRNVVQNKPFGRVFQLNTGKVMHHCSILNDPSNGCVPSGSNLQGKGTWGCHCCVAGGHTFQRRGTCMDRRESKKGMRTTKTNCLLIPLFSQGE